jgi:hypothetical protein
MELLELSLPDWSQPSANKQDNRVPCFLTKNQKDGTANIPYTGCVPEWVEVVFGWSEAETIRAYLKVEAILNRHGEESAEKWIVEHSRNFLDKSIDV